MASAPPLDFCRQAVTFFSAFVDGHHHAAEERLVFPLASGADELVEELRARHREGRVLLARTRERILDPDTPRAIEELEQYVRLLKEQLEREERELWPRLAGPTPDWPARGDLEALADSLEAWDAS